MTGSSSREIQGAADRPCQLRETQRLQTDTWGHRCIQSSRSTGPPDVTSTAGVGGELAGLTLVSKTGTGQKE